MQNKAKFRTDNISIKAAKKKDNCGVAAHELVEVDIDETTSNKKITLQIDLNPTIEARTGVEGSISFTNSKGSKDFNRARTYNHQSYYGFFYRYKLEEKPFGLRQVRDPMLTAKVGVGINANYVQANNRLKRRNFSRVRPRVIKDLRLESKVGVGNNIIYVQTNNNQEEHEYLPKRKYDEAFKRYKENLKIIQQGRSIPNKDLYPGHGILKEALEWTINSYSQEYRKDVRELLIEKFNIYYEGGYEAYHKNRGKEFKEFLSKFGEALVSEENIFVAALEYIKTKGVGWLSLLYGTFLSILPEIMGASPATIFWSGVGIAIAGIVVVFFSLALIPGLIVTTLLFLGGAAFGSSINHHAPEFHEQMIEFFKNFPQNIQLCLEKMGEIATQLQDPDFLYNVFKDQLLAFCQNLTNQNGDSCSKEEEDKANNNENFDSWGYAVR